VDNYVREKVTEKINALLRKYNLIYRMTTNIEQRDRVAKEINGFKKDLDLLDSGNFSDADIRKYLTEDDLAIHKEVPEEVYEMLEGVKISPPSPNCKNQEIIHIHSYLNYFEREYLGVLSEYHLKLVFEYSQKRDVLFNKFTHLFKILNEYVDIVNELGKDGLLDSYIEKLTRMKQKIFMTILIRCGETMSGIDSFVQELLADYKSGGNLVLNGDKIIEFDDIHGEKKVNGLTIIKALSEVDDFLREFLDFLNLPEV